MILNTSKNQNNQQINKNNKNNKPKNIEIETNNSHKNSNSKKEIGRRRRSTIFEEKNRIIMTDDNYTMMRNRSGRKSLITKEDLDKITCLQKEKCIYEQKAEEKEKYLKRLLKSELIQEKRYRKLSEKIKKRDKKVKAFLQNKNDGIKFIENERYQDNIDMHERKLLYDKILSNYNKKINSSKIQNSQNQEKMEELKEQIKDYERKNKQMKQKITKMFDIKENEDKLIKEAKKIDANNPNYGQMKMLEREEKFEINRFKREHALMNHINRVQSKINGYLENNSKKEQKIIQAIENVEKKREERKNLQSLRFEEMKDKVKINNKKLEKERQKKIELYEDKDLKNFAIRQEKIKLNEKKRIMSQLDKDERDILKNKIKKIIRSKRNLEEIEKDENFIDSVLYK